MYENKFLCVYLRTRRINMHEMKDKVNRLEAIKSIVSANRVGGQEELLQRLHEQGFDLTQATLSRDLKQLQIVKVSLPAGGYQYILPELAGLARRPKISRGGALAASNGFLSIAFSGNMAVIKTRPGYAGSTATDIDAHTLPELLGTLGGDDTVLLILREGVSREQAIEPLRVIIPNIQ